MKKKRLSKRLKVALLVLLGATPFACCLLCVFPWPIIQHETVGVRKDAQGNVVQEIILEHRGKWDIPFPGAHGWTGLFGRNNRAWGYKWFLDEPGKPRRELAFFRLKTPGPFYLGGRGTQEQCWPVEESPLWVYVNQTSPRSPHHEVVVFNDSQVLHKGYLRFEQELEGTNERYRYETSKRVIVYRRNQEYEAYDITTGDVIPWKEEKK